MYPNVRGTGDLNNNNNNQPGCKKMVQKFFESFPLFVKFIFVYSISIYLLSFISFFLMIFYYMLNVPFLTVMKLHLWRILTSVYINLSIFNLLFAFMSWLPSSMVQENQSGTTKYML